MLTVHGTSGFWILQFMFLKYVFFVFILDAIFCGTNFFIFQDSVWLVKKFWWVHCCSNHQFYLLAIVAEADLRCSDFLSEESCRQKLVVSTSFWSWLLNVSSVLISLKYAALLFWFVNALWVCWLFMGLLGFGFWYLFFGNMSFFMFILDAIFCGTSFFIFQDSVWLVKKFWCVHCCSIHQFHWVSDRRRSGFAQWWFFVRRKLSSQIGSFH